MSKLYCSVYNGLGNQLFGYAMGMYLAKKHNKQLRVDLTKLNILNFLSKTGLKKDTQREYELDKLGFTTPVINISYFGFLRKLKIFKRDKYLIADFRNSHKDLKDVKAKQHIYTIGWGDFGIVKEILPDLRRQFTHNFEITTQLAASKKIILEKNSVAIHIRRTDYLNSNLSDNFMGICTDEYYNNAISLIKEKVENPYFIIFSDDVEYVKENLNIENSYIIEGNKGYEDLYLMSLCKHFILANSTFGFWAAILNTAKNKTVCVPEYWYNTPLRMADYIPKEWIKLPIA